MRGIDAVSSADEKCQLVMIASRRVSLRTGVVAGLALVVSGCALTPARTPPPAELYAEALPNGLQGLRFWADDVDPDMKARARREAGDALLDRWQAAGRPEDGLGVDILALSGGAADGAYGAGLLAGWTANGTRPMFDIVTGISVGALIAPFAFLGSDEDAALRQIFTTLDTADVAELQLFRALFGAPSLARTEPLRRQIARFVDADFLDRIASEHERGRRLLVGTTNIDAARPVIWNLGAVAEAGQLELFRDVVLASASIPGAFPPIAIDVEARGRGYTELHVDGGVTHSVIVGPTRAGDALPVGLPFPVQRTIYIVMNLALVRSYEPIPDRLRAIVERSVTTLISSQSEGDVIRIHRLAEEIGADFRLTFLPPGFEAPQASAFDREYMTALFARGRADAVAGVNWLEQPPTLLGRRSVVDALTVVD